ncbi:hypothetical protein EVAR_69654_1 [Eumeta japonica]|uniref:Uncharacterized protein n=1 Tax=Eumeta variegata TaxID=151549 RepID=A0A4C2A7H9_EUMVA|nr:hypothetical protein EVAR_69654_1 [Eumeta japonica]
MGKRTKHGAHRSHPHWKPLRSSIDHHIRLRQLLDHKDVTAIPYALRRARRRDAAIKALCAVTPARAQVDAPPEALTSN